MAPAILSPAWNVRSIQPIPQTRSAKPACRRATGTAGRLARGRMRTPRPARTSRSWRDAVFGLPRARPHGRLRAAMRFQHPKLPHGAGGGNLSERRRCAEVRRLQRQCLRGWAPLLDLALGDEPAAGDRAGRGRQSLLRAAGRRGCANPGAGAARLSRHLRWSKRPGHRERLQHRHQPAAHRSDYVIRSAVCGAHAIIRLCGDDRRRRVLSIRGALHPVECRQQVGDPDDPERRHV